MIVASFDPGETTGWVRASINASDVCTVLILDIGTIQGIMEMNDQIDHILKNAEHVIVEDYRIYPTKALAHIGQHLYTSEEIGRITAYAYMMASTTEIIRQSASTAKQRFPDNRLEAYVGQFPSRHIADAARHLLCWAEREYGTLEVV